MKSDYTKRADDIKEFLAVCYEKKSHYEHNIAVLVEADAQAHVALDTEGMQPVDREITVIVHNLITAELALSVNFLEALNMNLEGLNQIYAEQLSLAKGERI